MGTRIIRAKESDFEIVKQITQNTIREVYPKYYPEGAVEFFSEHHSDERMMSDINSEIVYLNITEDNVPAGTVR